MKQMKPAALAVAAIASLACASSFAAYPTGPHGEADYEQQQAQPVSELTRAQVMADFQLARAGMNQWGDIGDSPTHVVASSASRSDVQNDYLQAAVAGTLPSTGEVTRESPAELALHSAPTADIQTAMAPPASYANPADSDVLAEVRAPWPEQPGQPWPADLGAASPDMISQEQRMALSEGEELVAQ